MRERKKKPLVVMPTMLRQEMRLEHNDYASMDDTLREVQDELARALTQMAVLLREGDRHLATNAEKVSDHIRTAGNIITAIRGIK